MGFRVEVDPDCCISSGNCVRAAPSAFAFENDVSSPQPGAAELSPERLVQIARTCPVGAIHVFGEDGTEIDPFAR